MARATTFDVQSSIAGLSNLNLNQVESSKEDVEVRQQLKEDNYSGIEQKSSGRGSEPLLSEILTPVKEKHLKEQRKTFLMTKNRAAQFKKLANERGQSENALFNDIMDQLFGKE